MAGAPIRSVLTVSLLLGWLAAMVSVVGDTLLDFLFVVSAARDEHPLSIGLIGFLVGLPALLGGWVGRFVDEHRVKIDMILVGSMATSAGVAGLLWTLWASSFMPIAVYISVFTLGTLALVATTTWQSSIPDLLMSDAADDIKRVMGWTATTFAVGTAMGPPIAAGLASWIGGRHLILLDAVSFFVAGILFLPAALKLKARHIADQPVAEKEALTATRVSWLKGLRLIFAEPLVRGPALALSLMNFIMFAASFAVPLLVVQRGLPDYVVSLVAATFVVGGIVGSVVGTYFRNEQMFLVYLIGEPVCRAAGLIVISLSPSIGGILVGVALFTIPQGMGRVARLGYMTTCFPRGQRASVIGSYQMLVRGLMPLAPLIMEGLVGAFGITTFFLCAAVVLTGISVLLAADGGLRKASKARMLAESVERVS